MAKYKIKPEEHAALIKERAAAKPSTVVKQEDYDKLMALYAAAEAANAKNPGKKNPETLAFQKAYHAILPEEARRIITGDVPTAKGKALDVGQSLDLPANEDSYFGKRTKQYLEGLQKYKPAAAVTPAATTPALADEKEKDETDYDGIYTDHLEETRYPPVAPAWWLQDKLAATNAGINALNIKRYNPYEPPVRYQTARGQYLSPERALAENRSIMNSQLNAVAQYGPQSMNARFSDIAGKSFANAANVIGNVHNQNQLIGNQLEQFNTGIKNQETRENVAHATSLWDKYQATRQNFDTERKRAFDNLTNVVNQGITNRANTYNLNQINPQTAVNPGQGGTMYFHDPRDFKPSTTPATINETFAANMRNPEYKQLANTPQGQQILWSLTQKQLGVAEDAMDQYGKNRNIPNQQVPVPSGYQGGYNQDT